MAIADSQVNRRFLSLQTWLSRLIKPVEAINQDSGRVLFGVTVFYLVLLVPLAMIKLLWACS